MSKNLKRLLSLFFLFSLPVCLSAGGQSTSSDGAAISGTIKDPSGAVVPGAQIVLAPTGTTAATDAQGAFAIHNVKPGTYTATVSYVGFGSSVSTVVLIGGQTFTLNVTLSIGGGNEQVTVTDNLTGDAAAINEQRISENILNVQTDVEIQSLPNANIADAVGRMPGVTLQRNEGEGQYVQIRGTEPRLSNTTIDGVLVPGPDPDVRQVDLDTIPADLVGSVAINKTLSANQDGDAIGGSVDLRIKQATSERPTLFIEGIGGFTPIEDTRKVFTINSSTGMRFGPRDMTGSHRFGFEMGYSYDYNGRGIDDVEPSPDLGPTGGLIYDELSLREYLYDRSRYGFAGALDYKLSDNAALYIHGLFSNFRDYGEKYEFDFKNSGSSSFHTSVRRPNLQIADLATGGNHVFNRSFLHYQIAVAHSRFGGAAGNPGADFSTTAANPDCAYTPSTTASIYRPQFNCDNPNDAATDPTQIVLDDINLTSGQATQLNLQAGASMGINYHFGAHASTLEFGGQFRNEHKGQDALSPTYDQAELTGTPPPLPDESQFLSTFRNPRFYGGSYYLPPVTNFASITTWLSANPSILPLDVAATHQASDASNYNLQERVSAGYIMNTIQLGAKFHLQTGLRIEATETSDTGYLVTTNADGSYGGTTPQTGSGSYLNPLPSVQLRYTIDGNSDIRAVYGRGISRPDPYQLVPYVVFTQGGATNGNNLVAIGNPSIVAEHANDYDLLYEKYLPNVGMIEAGYFYKQITQPIYLEQYVVPSTGSSLSQLYSGDEAQQEVNGDHAYVQGIEMAYQQRLKFLPSYLGNARINTNFTYTNSKNYNLVGRTDTPPLVGQAPYSWNIGPSYATKRALVTAGVSHNGANIFAYQFQNSGAVFEANPANVSCVGNIASGSTAYNTPSSPCGDSYFYSHTQVDAQATYLLAKGFSLLASGENMNNEVFGFFNGSSIYPAQREYYKPTYSFGLNWRLNHEQ
jgi:TonB-dependent receptor